MTVLTRTWAILMGLTAVSLLAGRPGGEGSIGLLGIGLVLMTANFKADQILTHFLGLQRAGSGWRMLFRVMLTLLGATIFGIYALTPMITAASR
ncbi:cytochrome C oxidase subunit IV family protein (plasmid) [Skermanella rosea]|uniref:cytochrome C oxidase subunit IV family protein n=1 Tax=Skermanella rosea TaxID=1817965 RepID=UPI0019341EC2|nr:cytochrome C oxidase subunit IV family protein [Skermanella rosea]UEM07714.1 cytochrome C oxidase subunit IV family protein [Skermanella rosea]